MNICLIKPPTVHKGASFTLMPAPPLGLAYIAGALKRDGHKIQVIDASAEGVGAKKHFNKDVYVFGLNKERICELIDEETDIVCFSFMFTNNWLYDREIVKSVKDKFKNAIIIAGGEHSNAAPEYCMHQSSIDYIVFGEGEETIVDLVNKIKQNGDISKIEGIAYRSNGEIVINKKRKRVIEIENIAWPAWELFPLDIYFNNKISYGVYRGRTLPVMASRGCPYDCTFCSSPQMWGRKYNIRSPQDFADELEFLNQNYGVTNFDFYDLTAIILKDWIIEFSEEIIKRKLDITYQLPSGTRAEAIDYEVAQALYKSGCKNITYAPESGSKKVLKHIRKKVNIQSMLNSIKYSSKAGMNIKLNMIIGFPDETHSDIWKTIWFLIRCSWYGANDTAPAIFSPYPGSILFKELEKERKLNMYDDEYIYDIIESYNIWPDKIYSKKVSNNAIKIYSFIILISFYSSNYLFRPIRLYRTIRNILTNKHESRLEQILHKNFLSNISFFNNSLRKEIKSN